MRKSYPITTNRQAPHAVNPMPNSLPGPLFGRRVSLVTLQEEIQLPTRRGLTSARRLKIVRIEQTAVLPDAPAVARPPFSMPALATSRPEASSRRALPPPQAEPPEFECWLEGKFVRLRRVGEMMADEAGNFYEVTGEQLRPLGELVSDERGRVFEVLPASEIQPAEAAKEKPNGRSNDQKQIVSASKPDDSHRAETSSQPARAQAVRATASPGYRKIITDPGLYLKIPWARVKSELTPQLKHPEKLYDHDVLECYAQIYEAQRTLLTTELAAFELGDASFASQLHPLTQNKAQMLGAPQLFKPTREPFETRATSRQIYAGQRVYRLWPLFDPTVNVGQTVSLPQSSQKSHRAGKDKLTVCPTTEATPRRQIPQQYLNPLQFKYSREEVLYDMRGVLGTLPVESGALVRWLFVYPLRLLKTLITLISSRKRMKKWRAMLKGKSPDEQLWTVTPPHGFYYHPAVRRWAEESLAQAGYDAEGMPLEWEVFWRRKGRD